jgi:23S rRNA pseudouridine2605 synthase
MRINKWLALHTDLSRRKADDAISNGRVRIDSSVAKIGDEVTDISTVMLDGKRVTPSSQGFTTIMLNKPVGYVCSRTGQGSRTIYHLLPTQYHHLQPVGRLDKYTSGLLLLTNNGSMLNELTHPSFNKEKVYFVELQKPLTEAALTHLKRGVDIGDERQSYLRVTPKPDRDSSAVYTVRLNEGRNRQIRRTFDALGYDVMRLHRSEFAQYKLDMLKTGDFREIVVK